MSRASFAHLFSIEVRLKLVRIARLRRSIVILLGSTFAKPLERNALTSRDMALKHLLNDDDVDDFRPGSHSSHPNWHQQDPLDYALDGSWSRIGVDDPIFTAALPTQSWDQYVNELLGSQIEGCDPVSDGDSVDIYSSFQETSADIEQWTTGHVPHQAAEEQTPTKQEHICYGMVSRTDLFTFLLSRMQRSSR